VLLSSLLINYTCFTLHHRSALMTHLIPSQIANDIPPSVNKLPPLRSLLLFSVRRFQVISAAAMVIFSFNLRYSGSKNCGAVQSWTSFLHLIHSLFDVRLGMNCIRLRSYDLYDVRSGGRLVEDPRGSSDGFDKGIGRYYWKGRSDRIVWMRRNVNAHLAPFLLGS
jgi:hypothetical protein